MEQSTEDIRVLAEYYRDKYEELQQKLFEVQNQNEMFKLTFDLAEIGLYITDYEGTVLFVNRKHQEITGLKQDTIIGRKTSELEVESKCPSATMDVLRTREVSKKEQFLSNGKSYFVYGKPFFDNKGNIKYVVSTLIDNTEINRIKQELSSSNADKVKLKEMVEKLKGRDGIAEKIICVSEAMKNTIDLCEKVALFDAPILLQGEVSNGKGIIAKYIAEKSDLRSKEFYKVSCSNMSEDLLESELFGYEPDEDERFGGKGKIGFIELADGGTVYISNINEMPLSVQNKLLKLLKTNKFYRLCGKTEMSVKVKLIFSTNSDLEVLVRQKKFLKELYQKISLITIKVPRLSDRREDIPFIVHQFVNRYNEKFDDDKEISYDVIDYLQSRRDIVNFDNLKKIIEKALLLSEKRILTAKAIEQMELTNAVFKKIEEGTLSERIDRFEKEIFEKCFETYKTEKEISKALGISQATVSRRLMKYGLMKE